MRIGIGIAAIGISVFFFLQSFTLLGLSGIATNETVQQAASVGILASLMLFLGGAFSFGAPKLAIAFYFLASVAAFLGRAGFPDLSFYAAISATLAFFMVLLVRNADQNEVDEIQKLAQPKHEIGTTELRHGDNDDLFKDCPHCAEPIRAKAVLCRYCQNKTGWTDT